MRKGWGANTHVARPTMLLERIILPLSTRRVGRMGVVRVHIYIYIDRVFGGAAATQ